MSLKPVLALGHCIKKDMGSKDDVAHERWFGAIFAVSAYRVLAYQSRKPLSSMMPERVSLNDMQQGLDGFERRAWTQSAL